MSSMFDIGDRVIARRKIRPFRKDGYPTIRAQTPGTVHAVYANTAYVEFDSLACPVHVHLGDIDLLSLDEQFVLGWGYWSGRAGGYDAS